MYNNPTNSTVNAATSSTTPAWVDGLKTASIRADMTAADVNGTVTYSGLEKLFTDLVATHSVSNTSVTKAEFSDLKTIADNLNHGMSTSSYLTYITDALVNGNKANEKWMGGGDVAVDLGNLKAGSSATQLSELVGKWFEGTDLPSSTLHLDSKYGTTNLDYAANTDPLFGPSGPQMSDVNQGHSADCYFLGTLAEVAKQNPDIISSMFTDNGNGTYGVRFYVDGVAKYVTVNDELPTNVRYTNTPGDGIWASLAEKAYAQLQGSGDITGTNHDSGNSYSTIANDGSSRNALEEVTGASTTTVYKPDGENCWKSREDDSSFTKIGSSSGISTKDLLATLKSDLAKGDDLLLNSKTTEYDQSSGPSHGMTTLVGAHVMSIVGIDGNGDLEIRNPWGTRPNQTFETTFTESLSYLNSLGDSITVDDVGKNVSQLAQAMAAFSPNSPAAVGASPVQSDAAATLSHMLAPPAH